MRPACHSGVSRDRAPAVQPGFTLVELLVVIAVMAILAALLLPTIGGAMKSANSANCKSNLRQIATAFVLYYKQYKGLMPPSGSPSAKPPNRFPHWCKNLEPFAGNPEIFRCPSKKRARYGYGLNHMWCGPDHIFGGGTAMNNRSKEFDMIVNPSGTVIICDTGVVTNKDAEPDVWLESDASNENGCCRFPYDNRPGDDCKFIYWVSDPRRPVPRHMSRKANCMFFDGHVEGIVARDIVDDMWDEPNCIYDNDRMPPRKVY